VRDNLSNLGDTVAEPLVASLAPALPGFHAPAPQLNLLQRLLYSGGLIGGYIADTAIVTWALYYYAPPAGHGQALAPITWVAAALVFGRIIDAVLNPVVGYWSDRSHDPRGRRIPFMARCVFPSMALPRAILADTIDYEYGLTGKRRSAMYIGIQGVLQKSAMALAPAVLSVVFTVFGYSQAHPLGVYLVGPVGGFLFLAAWFVFSGYELEDR